MDVWMVRMHLIPTHNDKIAAAAPNGVQSKTTPPTQRQTDNQRQNQPNSKRRYTRHATEENIPRRNAHQE